MDLLSVSPCYYHCWSEPMDELVGSVGFEKMGMEIDPWGIFTVSWARRV